MPIIVASARHQEAEKIGLLDDGADDYLTKPFGVSELLARIRVALRHRGTTLPPATTRYERGDLLIDLDAYRVERDGRPLHLTPTEFKLAARLVRAGGRVVTHRQLLADVWGAGARPTTRTTCASTWRSCAPSSRPCRRSRATCSPKPASAIGSSSTERAPALCDPDANAPTTGSSPQQGRP